VFFYTSLTNPHIARVVISLSHTHTHTLTHTHTHTHFSRHLAVNKSPLDDSQHVTTM
jgi:hypothetical protein